MPELHQMTTDERSLLLYFESCAVDYGGTVDARRMNAEDFTIAERWAETGFVRFGRIRMADIRRLAKLCVVRPPTYWVEISEDAWRLAHAERRARCARITKERTWKKTVEAA